MPQTKDKDKAKKLFKKKGLTLFSSKVICLDDGVGYLDELDESETEELFIALKKLFRGRKKECKREQSNVSDGDGNTKSP